MADAHLRVLRSALKGENYDRLMAIRNSRLHEFIADAVELCAPESVFVCADTPDDIQYVRQQALALREELPLRTEGHTVHFDGIEDQGRDREVTRYLVPENESLAKSLNQIERGQGLTEVRGLLKDSMLGRIMIVRFLSLGPTDSVFSVPCVQVTDSFYVAHSEDLLYRPAYAQFLHMAEKTDFFHFLHSAGKLDEHTVSAEPNKKRIYIDYTTDTIYSVNTQYAGNTMGLKKLALRLTIRKADQEGWLAEHMFLMGVHGPKGRKTYFAGAFPSACGKTSTAMLAGETIMGDDIAYFRAINGEPRAVNAERGIFGIIQDINANGDPAIYRVLTTPGEVIFSNVLVKDGRPHWLGMGCDLPKDGVNFSGPWFAGKKDVHEKPIPPAHKNARYSVCLKALANADPELDNPQGVVVGGIVYGGRDAHAYVPVQQSFSWEHGIIAYGASLETETTFATLGLEGVPEINVMSIQDFLAIPLGRYIQNNLSFADKVKNPPAVFGVNYFLRGSDGKFLNAIRDKAVWMKWMELRVRGEAGAIKGVTGWIPKYADLHTLFREVLGKEYSQEDYVEQFALRVPENLAKIDRVERIYIVDVHDAPRTLYKVLDAQRQRLLAAQKAFGDRVTPAQLEKLAL